MLSLFSITGLLESDVGPKSQLSVTEEGQVLISEVLGNIEKDVMESFSLSVYWSEDNRRKACIWDCSRIFKCCDGKHGSFDIEKVRFRVRKEAVVTPIDSTFKFLLCKVLGSLEFQN